MSVCTWFEMFIIHTHSFLDSHLPERCCFNYMNAAIPAQNVERFETTSPSCTKPGVMYVLFVFIMVYWNINIVYTYFNKRFSFVVADSTQTNSWKYVLTLVQSGFRGWWALWKIACWMSTPLRQLLEAILFNMQDK